MTKLAWVGACPLDKVQCKYDRLYKDEQTCKDRRKLGHEIFLGASLHFPNATDELDKRQGH